MTDTDINIALTKNAENNNPQSKAHHRSIKNVAITGGTHGNEITGVYCIYHLQDKPQLLPKCSFDIALLLSNPTAIDQNKRYIEKDFNRCFSNDVSDNQALSHLHEVKLAMALRQQLQNSNNATDFIIDLHTTTSNMGTTIIFQHTDWLTLSILRAIATKLPNCHFLYEPYDKGNSPYLISCAPHGIMIEVGPTPQGQLMAQCFFDTLQAVQITLSVLEQYNQSALPEQSDGANEPSPLSSQEETVYTTLNKVKYPLNSQKQIAAMIHPNLQHKDFSLLQSGDPVFLDFDNNTIAFEGEPCYPIFINEAAYYDEGYAFTLTEQSKKVFSDIPYSINSAR